MSSFSDKSIYGVMLQTILEAIKEVPLELISQAEGSQEKTDKASSETYEESFVRLEVEVPRGNGSLSRCRFAVKVPSGSFKTTTDELDEVIHYVTFDDLEISYVDSARKLVYFRADNYSLKKGSD